MFTGLVESTGVLRARAGARLSIETNLSDLALGDSVAVSGVCLTVTAVSARGFEVDLSAETTGRSTLGALPPGSPVNLERSLRVGDRLGGHFVSGHVDDTVVAELVERLSEAWRVRVGFAPALGAFIAEKGSVALDGVSLTVNAVQTRSFEVMLIPHTLAHTTLADLAPGRRLNLEVDVLARYVVHALSEARSDDSLQQALRRAGMLT